MAATGTAGSLGREPASETEPRAGPRSSALNIRPDSGLHTALIPGAAAAGAGRRPPRQTAGWTTKKKCCVGFGCLVGIVAVVAIAIGIMIYVGRVRFPTLPPPCTHNCVTVDNSEWTEVLQAYTSRSTLGPYTTTVVNYTGLLRYRAQDPSNNTMARYTARLANLDLAKVNNTARKAVFLNAYNLFTVTMILDNPCDGALCSSINDIGSLIVPVWKRKAGVVGGLTFSLDNIEQDYLRKLGDPRVHSAMNCASISCPDLRRVAYETAGLSTQLDNQVGLWLSSTKRAFDLDESSVSLELNKIFDWYSGDFKPSVPLFVAKYCPVAQRSFVASHAASLAVTFFEYDWNLNGV